MTEAAQQIAELSNWIDRWGLPDATYQERLWGRTAKIAEEYGEVVAAIIGHLGQNPRKGTTHSVEDVVAELLDVAVTALGAVESVQGNDGRALGQLAEKIDAVHGRMRTHLLANGLLTCACGRQADGCDRPAAGGPLCVGCGYGCTEDAYLAAEDLRLHLSEDESFAGVMDQLDAADVPA